MTATPCQLLDDYLAHDLTGEEHARFEAHLPNCVACRRIVWEEQALKNLLTTAVERLEPVPGEVISRTQRRLRSVRRRRFAAGITMIAASIVILVFVSRPLFLREVEPPQPAKHDLPQPRLADVGPPPVDVRVRFPRAADVIAVPVASESPHVTVVQVYSSFRDRSSDGGVNEGRFRFNQGEKHEQD